MDSASRSHQANGFQARGQAWDPFRDDIIQLLETSRHRDLAPIYYGSNHCFLVTLSSDYAGESLAVYKPARGEYPLYDFAEGTLYKREVSSWLVNSLLGWNIVPPTVVSDGRFGPGSLQLFIETHEQAEIEIRELQRLALLDLSLNNADRKSEHCLLGQDGKLWGIDHGLTFHPQPKLRTVLWHFANSPIPKEDLNDLRRINQVLNSESRQEVLQMRELLAPYEFRALKARLERLVSSGTFPNPRHKAIPYRW